MLSTEESRSGESHRRCFSGVKWTISTCTAWHFSIFGGIGHNLYVTSSPGRGIYSPSMLKITLRHSVRKTHTKLVFLAISDSSSKPKTRTFNFSGFFKEFWLVKSRLFQRQLKFSQNFKDTQKKSKKIKALKRLIFSSYVFISFHTYLHCEKSLKSENNSVWYFRTVHGKRKQD